MIFADDDGKNQNSKEFRNMTVDEFLYSHYKDCEGNELFQYIYPVALGVREILVQHRYAQEAIELCKEIKQDMYKYMSTDAAEDIFEDFNDIQEKAANHKLWEPFRTSIDYNWANDEPNDNMNKRSKQTKRSNDHEQQKQPRMSYVQATKNQESTPNTPVQPRQQGTTNHPPQENEFDTMTQFQKLLEQSEAKQHERLSKLEVTQQEQAKNQKSFEDKQERSNRHMLQEIQNTNDNINNKVIVTIEQTNNNIMDIRQQLIAIVMNFNIPKDNIQQPASFNSDDDMILDKDINKRNIQGTLRDGNGNIADCDKENFTAGGNHNNCNFSKTDYFGDRNP
jgi:hypothetical protein